MNQVLVLGPLLLVGLFLALLLPVVVNLFRRCRVEDVTPEWLEDFSASSYHMMAGLLSDEDFKFLSSQPGFDLSLYRKLRRDRLHIFKQYLDRSIRDFNRLDTAIRSVIAYSKDDCSALAARLILLKMRFSCAIVRAEVNYRLCLLGLRTIEVRALINYLEQMSAELNALSSAQTA